MTDETTNTIESGTPAPTGSAAYTDEQLAEAFPGQDISHVKAMLDKAAGVGVPTDPHEGKPNGAAPATPEDTSSDEKGDSSDEEGGIEYPEYIPEKFRKGSVEEAMQKLAESYKVLEGSRRVPAADGGEPASSGDGSDAGSDAEGPSGHVDLRSIEAKFVENGKLTEADYAAAEKSGLDRGTVDAYIAGQQAIAQQLVTKVHSMVGGPDTYEAMLQWMVGNLPKAEVEAYDEAMGTGSEAKIAVAVRGVHAAYLSAVGSDQGRRVAPTTGQPKAPGFQSKREMIDAMKDPRYSKDAAYRAEVARRIENGNVW